MKTDLWWIWPIVMVLVLAVIPICIFIVFDIH